MNIRVRFDAAATLLALEQSRERTIEHMRRALSESCRLVARSARENHKFQAKSGELERSIRHKVFERTVTGIVWLDKNVAPYGIFVHEPTGKHAPASKRLPSKFHRYPDGSYEIRSTNYRHLKFVGRNGNYVRTESVRHPGSPADQFLYQAADRNRAEINAIFARHNMNAIREAGL